jgi:predicted PurR-regulated permease PerM
MMGPDTPPLPLRPAPILGLAALFGLMLGCFFVLRPFLSALLWAAILAFCTWPAFILLRDRLRLRPGLAAALMVTVQMLVIGLPLAFAAPVSREDVDRLRGLVERLLTEGLPGLVGWLTRLPYVGGFLAERFGELQFDLSGITGMIQPYAGVIAQQVLAVLLAVLSGVAELALAILLSFFFYRDGANLAEAASGVMSRIVGPRGRSLLVLVGNVTQGVVYGLLGTAVAQGVLTAIGLWIAGVPQPVLLGVVAGLISIFPIGAPVVWIPATLWLFTQGQTGWGIFLGLYGALGISSVDNVIRPWLISRGADLPLLLTLLGALGGVFAFGFLGLFLGPVLLAVGYYVLKDWIVHVVPEHGPKEGPAA